MKTVYTKLLTDPGLAIDATYTTDLEEKFTRIRDDIKKGKLATIKYFYSSEMEFMGQLSQIPRILIGAKNETIAELLDMQRAKNKTGLANHWIQFQILEQAIEQLTVFEEFAKKCNQQKTSSKIARMNKKMKKILEERKNTIKDPQKRDGFNDLINAQLISDKFK